MRIMQEKNTGVFGTVKEEIYNQSYEILYPVSDDNPNIIYNLLFNRFDEDNNK